MNAKEVVFADNFSLAGILNCIKDYWDKLTAIGPKYRYSEIKKIGGSTKLIF